MDVTEHVEMELPLEPESAHRARSALAPLGAHADASTFDDVRLLVSELVCDALATEPRPAESAITMEAEVVDGVTQVKARFDGLTLRLPATKPQPAEPGWGVYLVQTLANRWGAQHDDGNTYIWFEA